MITPAQRASPTTTPWPPSPRPSSGGWAPPGCGTRGVLIRSRRVAIDFSLPRRAGGGPAGTSRCRPRSRREFRRSSSTNEKGKVERQITCAMPSSPPGPSATSMMPRSRCPSTRSSPPSSATATWCRDPCRASRAASFWWCTPAMTTGSSRCRARRPRPRGRSGCPPSAAARTPLRRSTLPCRAWMASTGPPCPTNRSRSIAHQTAAGRRRCRVLAGRSGGVGGRVGRLGDRRPGPVYELTQQQPPRPCRRAAKRACALRSSCCSGRPTWRSGAAAFRRASEGEF